MNTIFDYIQGERFRDPLFVDNKRVFYCNTYEVDNFFKNPPKKEFVLVSHNADEIITYNGRPRDANVNLIPRNLVKWFGQNVNVIHPKIESLPIGLENSMYFVEIKKLDKIKNKLNNEKKIKNLVYMNHTIANYVQDRLEPYKLFTNKSWCKSVMGTNGYNFDEYLDDIYNHEFVISPRGNGIDTHRLWESLYLGTIPIEKRNLNNRFYDDLPICFVDNWSDINEEFLNKELIRIKNKKWNLDKLNFWYWKERIYSC